MIFEMTGETMNNMTRIRNRWKLVTTDTSAFTAIAVIAISATPPGALLINMSKNGKPKTRCKTSAIPKQKPINATFERNVKINNDGVNVFL